MVAQLGADPRFALWPCVGQRTDGMTRPGRHWAVKAPGQQATTGKDILPMAPVANAERCTDAAKVEKWFKRNRSDVLKRASTANEKGDFIAYRSSVKQVPP